MDLDKIKIIPICFSLNSIILGLTTIKHRKEYLKIDNISHYQLPNPILKIQNKNNNKKHISIKRQKMQRALQTINRVKLHFLMKKKVSYGLGIYVIGNIDELGHWNILDSLRLNWNTDDYWSGFVQLQIQHSIRLQFKYAIAKYDMPSQSCLQWEEGEFNRQLVINDDEDNIIIENVWGANKICLNLLVPKYVIRNDTEIYLAGGCNQLGNWKNRLKMDRIPIQNLSQTQISKAKQNIIIQNYQVYSVQLIVQRNLRCFNYYFIKKNGGEWLPDRVPQRQFIIDSVQNHHPTCLHISDKSGHYQLLQLSKFVQLYYSKITQRIFIGGCIETCDDVKQLKKKGVTAIMYLASSQHVHGKLVPKNLIKMISEENKIQYWSVKIQISRVNTLIQQAKQAIQILVQLLETQEKVVYVYCTTGTLLAPLLVSLYLYTHKNFPLKRALQYVKQKHPIASIDEQIMELASQFAQQNYFNRQNFDTNRRKTGKITTDE